MVASLQLLLLPLCRRLLRRRDVQTGLGVMQSYACFMVDIRDMLSYVGAVLGLREEQMGLLFMRAQLVVWSWQLRLKYNFSLLRGGAPKR